jgi:hypothetical protein
MLDSNVDYAEKKLQTASINVAITKHADGHLERLFIIPEHLSTVA